MDVGQSLVTTTVTEGETLVIETELMQDRGVEVVDRQRRLGDGVAELVGRPEGETAAEAAAGEEEGVAVDVVVATGRLANLGRVGRPAHLAGPEHDRLVQQSAPLQVHDQGRDRLVGDQGVLSVVLLQVAVLVPGGVVGVGQRAGDLDEPDPRLDEPSGAEALQGVELLVVVRPVESVERRVSADSPETSATRGIDACMRKAAS